MFVNNINQWTHMKDETEQSYDETVVFHHRTRGSGKRYERFWDRIAKRFCWFNCQTEKVQDNPPKGWPDDFYWVDTYL